MKIYILILLFLFINSINSYIIKDVRVTNTLPKAYGYPSSECGFTYNIYCAANQPDEQCKTLDYSIPPSVNPVILMENETSSITSASWTIATGTVTITVNSIYTFNLTCLEYNLNDITGFKPYGGVSFMGMSTKKVLEYGAFYEIQGLDTSSGVPLWLTGTCNIPNCYFSYYGGLNKYLLYIYDPINSQMNLSSNISVSIINQAKVFTFEPIFKDLYDQIYDIKTYPSSENLSNLYLFGVGESSIISFKSNNTVFKTSYVINQNGVSTSTQFFPIYGDEYSTTYLYSMANFDMEVQYDLYYQSGSGFLKSNQSITGFTHKASLFSLASTGTFSPFNGYSNIDNFVQYKYSDPRQYMPPPVKITIDEKSKITNFPFGYSKIMNVGYEFSYCFPSKNILKESIEVDVVSLFDNSGTSGEISSPQSYNTSNLPTITNIKTYLLKDNLYLFRVSAKVPYGLSNIEGYDGSKFGHESIISGSSTEGIYEFVQIARTDSIFKVYDIYKGLATAGTNTIISISPEPQIFISPQYREFNEFSIQNISFLYNDLDVTNHRHYNVMYFNYTDEVPRETVFSLSHSGASTFNPLEAPFDILSSFSFTSKYDTDIQLFKIEFYVEANIEYGDWLYIFIANDKVTTFDAQLRIKKTNTDLQGPIFKNISQVLPNLINSTNNIETIGWKVVIEDLINGFDYGYVTVRASWSDFSVYNITFNSKDVKSGDIYSGEYDILFTIEYPCYTVDYYISEVLLVDRVGRKSFFTMVPQDYLDYIGAVNPFLLLLNDSESRMMLVTCEQSEANSDTTGPVLKSFILSTDIIDVGKTNRNVTFIFTAEDPESGLKNYQYPIVYLISSQEGILECKSTILSINKINATYSCTIEIPLGYAYPNQIMLSVYGFINNNGLVSGYDTYALSSVGTAYINTKFDQTINEPSITKHHIITENGGDLLLFGKGFGSDSTAYITFYDGSTSIIKASTIYPSAIIIPNIRPSATPYQLYIKTNSLNSNNLTIIPIVYDYYLNIGPITPTITPVPTNSPQQCPGNPVCGGPSNGKCIPNQGCVCYSPWIGLDCLSQVIIVDKPTTNDTSPSTNITLPVNNNNNSSTTVTYKSLITLVSIREINILGTVVFNKTFDKWQVRELDNTTFIYNTTLEIEKNNKVSTTDFKVTLKWFINETSITFANEQLIMNPSTMKYTIEINNYPFDNNLNQLQLVMSASIQSNSSDNICSLREYGETTSGDSSNYLKIQVDNHSLYGRFIRRGIVDSTITTITNVLLDKDMNSITTTKELQSYIGIQIPNFKHNVIIDPDFSVILDSNSASAKSGSICSGKSKLSGAKIAGIVIGCAAFVSIIIISVLYHIIKKKKEAQFIANVNQKMKQMNNDKL